MKRHLFLAILLAIGSAIMAQQPKPRIQKASQSTLVQQPAIKIYQKMAPDLLPTPPAIHTSNGKRYIQAFTANKGNMASKPCFLIVTYSWKYDYELFTQKKIVKKYAINALAANASTSVIFQVPDDQISSNKTYGSKNVAIKLEVDGTQLVIEQDEQNNSKSVSLPILNH